jgi:hypothetical protein
LRLPWPQTMIPIVSLEGSARKAVMGGGSRLERKSARNARRAG